MGPWEGSDIYGVSILFVEPGTDPNDPDEWLEYGLVQTATKDEDGWNILVTKDPGTYDIWIIAQDDRSIYALYVEEGVTIEEPVEGDDLNWYPWAFTAILVLAAVSIGIIIRGRSKA